MKMRFIDGGPQIPHELLLARDQGRVVFFCGAGVSRPAGLPDFLGLLQQVIKNLRLVSTSPVQQALDRAEKINQYLKESDATAGFSILDLYSADRLFEMLVDEFGRDLVEEKVAQALVVEHPDLAAHNTILDLATTPGGRTQLVTTNFDRLFERCGCDLTSWQSPTLPVLELRPSDMDGIVYLHGRVTDDYSGAAGDGVVLSSSDFGRAYLAEGWATGFVKNVLDKYFVVFIGYSADDPPVQYLLDALKTSGGLNNVYAFQSVENSGDESKWRTKGVTAISYSPENDHSNLWGTLKGWAERARDVEGWYAKVVNLAKNPPATLRPFERGQVAHIASAVDGMRKFSEGESFPPAEWLCVFDPRRRYERPGTVGDLFEVGEFVDPFELYGLDFDLVPPKWEPDDLNSHREVPNGAWSVFDLNSLDEKDLGEANIIKVYANSSSIPELPSRLGWLITWFGKVIEQPAAIWWVANQNHLHPRFRTYIRSIIARSSSLSPKLRQAWCLLIESWEHEAFRADQNKHLLNLEINNGGWNYTTVRKFSAYCRPFFKIDRGFFTGRIPPNESEYQVHQIMSSGVGYPKNIDDFEVPDQWLVPVVTELRKNLELAVDFEYELGGFGLSNTLPISPINTLTGHRVRRDGSLPSYIFNFSLLFKRLMRLDPKAAKEEFSKWNVSEKSVFGKLALWVVGHQAVFSIADFLNFIVKLNSDVFWYRGNHDDLMKTLVLRWSELSEGERNDIESKILAGPVIEENSSERQESFAKRRAYKILNKINYLADQGCEFSFSLTSKNEELMVIASDWTIERANSESSRRKNTDNQNYPSFSAEPLKNILPKASSYINENGVVDRKNPFFKLIKERPVKAFSTLRLAAEQKELPKWAWEGLLNARDRDQYNPRFISLIACRIVFLPDCFLISIVRSLSGWFISISQKLVCHDQKVFQLFLKKVIDVLYLWTKTDAYAEKTLVAKNDWNMEAINHPAGQVARAMFFDPIIDSNELKNDLPKYWLEEAKRLLDLPNLAGYYSLVIFSRDIDWLHSIDTGLSTIILKAASSEVEEESNAFWEGFFWSATIPSATLYLELKPLFFEIARKNATRLQRYHRLLSGILLSGWSQDYVSDKELRDVLVNSSDEFRLGAIFHSDEWLSEEAEVKDWLPCLTRLFDMVWPQQAAVSSPEISTAICDLLFSNLPYFKELVGVTIPFLTKVKDAYFIIPYSKDNAQDVLDVYPEEALLILHTVLPDDVSVWPHDMQSVFSKLIGAKKLLEKDPRLVELKRKWDSR